MFEGQFLLESGKLPLFALKYMLSDLLLDPRGSLVGNVDQIVELSVGLVFFLILKISQNFLLKILCYFLNYFLLGFPQKMLQGEVLHWSDLLYLFPEVFLLFEGLALHCHRWNGDHFKPLILSLDILNHLGDLALSQILEDIEAQKMVLEGLLSSNVFWGVGPVIVEQRLEASINDHWVLGVSSHHQKFRVHFCEVNQIPKVEQVQGLNEGIGKQLEVYQLYNEVVLGLVQGHLIEAGLLLVLIELQTF